MKNLKILNLSLNYPDIIKNTNDFFSHKTYVIKILVPMAHEPPPVLASTPVRDLDIHYRFATSQPRDQQAQSGFFI
jgi:hypothetical protein